MHQEIISKAFEAFRPDSNVIPPMTLRGGDAADSYSLPPPYDAALDQPTDEYLEKYFWGVAHLDPVSWRHYLPHLISYALRNLSGGGSMVVDSLLLSLRPPDREPARLESLSEAQEEVVVLFLDALAFAKGSAWQEYAMQVLEEYWVPNALYRGRR